MRVQKIVIILSAFMVMHSSLAMEPAKSTSSDEGDADNGLYFNRETPEMFAKRIRSASNQPVDPKYLSDIMARLAHKRDYKEVAFFPRKHLIAGIYLSKKHKDVRKLAITNWHTHHEQKSDVSSDFQMPNDDKHPTLAFDKIGSRVAVLERLHKTKNQEEWRQSCQIVPVTVAHAVEAKGDDAPSSMESNEAHESDGHFIVRVRDFHNKFVEKKYYSMILKQDGPAESTCYSWSPDQKTLGILDWGHTARKEHPLHKALLSIIYTEKNDKVTSYECDKHKYESLAIDPSAGLVAMTYRCEHDTDKRKLVIKNLHTGDEQTFDIPQHFKMPNVSQDPTIAFNKDGNAVVVIENIHVVKTYEEDATVEFGKRQDWRQLYKIFPVPVAMLIGAKNAKESTT